MDPTNKLMIDQPKIFLVFSSKQVRLIQSKKIIAAINVKHRVIKISLHRTIKFMILALNGNFVASNVTVIIQVTTKIVIDKFYQQSNKMIQLVNTTFFNSQNRLKFRLKNAFVYKPLNQLSTQEQFNKQLCLTQILQVLKNIIYENYITYYNKCCVNYLNCTGCLNVLNFQKSIQQKRQQADGC
ncbi:unnamed protein product (macronuclear) [Paramecium tetraurelia]|uniref:Transmembrane protein n=1 Tax=Paramecium tetraurelia TaxID=5888 RepID=A0DT60_PARTE|nr:uncharacterized protein GSPATT00019920001 [Paramecium tetraurelia]CAK86227.1 unnamed protein product [Paramecium tetraurelia]|eukprot:XP_001453624.1 hypothetical protein (macronuclear) [Paramecium tetraurelia strain d4-2]